MQLTINETNMKIENGKLIINIDSNLEKLLGIDKVELSKVEPGQVIKSDIGIEYIVLEQCNNGATRVIRKDLLPERKEFDSNSNNFATSSLRKYLNDEYYKEEIVPGFGECSVIEHDIDLLSLDGFDDYGTCGVKVGLLTIDDYRKYHKNLLKDNMDSWWWLSTPDSTPTGYGDGFVRFVSSRGNVYYDGYRYDKGVRPDLILKSNIFVSLTR